MSFETTTYKLIDAINIIGGGTPKRSNLEFWNGNIPWLSVVDFNSGSRFVSDTVEKITEAGLKGSSTKILDKDDLIISARGTVGCLAQLRKPMAFNQSCYGLSGKEGIVENDYLYYLVKSKVSELKQKTHGAVFDTITRETFNHIEVEIPNDHQIRSQIAKILGDLDKKIELNRQTNQTLEQIAQALFKSWFVDFDPVKAKIAAKQAGGNAEQIERAAMAAISGKSEPELDQLTPDQLQNLKTTAALFPSAMQTTELNEIPVEWELQRLSETIKIIGGGTPKRSEPDYWSGSINWFSVKDAPNDGDVFVIDTEEKITKLGVQKSSTKVLPVGTTIISARGTVGKLALAGVETAMNQSCYGVKGIDGIGQYLNYLNVKYMVTELQQNTHGAVFDTITKDTFETVQIVKASNEINCRFEGFITPLFEQIRNQLFEINTLADTRDSLLPKLLSGEFN